MSTLDLQAIYLSVFHSLDTPISTQEDLAFVLQQTGRNPTQKALQNYWQPRKNGMNFDDFVDICRKEPVTTKDDLMKAFRENGYKRRWLHHSGRILACNDIQRREDDYERGNRNN